MNHIPYDTDALSDNCKCKNLKLYETYNLYLALTCRAGSSDSGFYSSHMKAIHCQLGVRRSQLQLNENAGSELAMALAAAIGKLQRPFD